jgi:aryl-alcohol dehydrogenase-like predicted oxidoreductase
LADNVGGEVKLRTLGRTGLSVSEIGFGCGPTGGLMIRGSSARRREAVACALDLGINYFDTAPGYGANVSETHLGETLRELGARVTVATKVALALDDLAGIVGAIQRSVEQSLTRLRLDELALIQLHNRIGLERAAKAPFGTGALLAGADVSGPDGVLEAFERLRERGLVRHFGCSAFGGDMQMMQRLIDSDRVDVLTVHYSMLNRTAWRGQVGGAVLDYSGVGRRAAARGMGTVALRVLEGGALPAAGGALPGDPGALPGDAGADAAPLARALETAGIEPAEGAIRFVLSNPEVGVALVGFSDVEQIRKAAGYSRAGPLPRELLNLPGGE